MSARVVCLSACIAACYAPSNLAGTPCQPDAGCPYGLSCELVDGDHICVEAGGGPPVGARGWNIVQTRGTEDRDINLPDPTGEGNAVIVGVETSSRDFPTDVTDDAGNTYGRLSNSRARDSMEDLGIELWIAVDSQPDARRINVEGGIVHAVVVWEVAGIDGDDPIVATAHEDDQPESTMPSGAAITTEEPGQFVISIAIVANRVDRLVPDSPFDNDHETFGNGWAHLREHDAPAGTYTAQWIQPQLGSSCATSAALRLKP